ncbi:MAG: Na+/H+ antiporter NhaA [Candidatus Cryptobacteroides sp.]
MNILQTYSIAKQYHLFEKGRYRLFSKPWAAGGLLLVCVILAMLLANLPFTRDYYNAFLHTSLAMSIQSPADAGGFRTIDWVFPRDLTVEKFINDILMVVFFFTVGLEIKREVRFGQLSSVKKALLPVIAAAGGMAMPALIYILINGGTAAATGWGIPTATDIAFAMGIMSIMGNRVPLSLKVFLTALAIADDLGAILVVAFFYGGDVNWHLLMIAAAVVAVVILLNKRGEKRIVFYIIPTIVVWFLFYYAGIHATMSGVVMALIIPMEPRFSHSYFNKKCDTYQKLMHKYENEEKFPNMNQRTCLRNISHIAEGTVGMSYRMEHALSPWVNFVIMPIFALANAGVEILDPSYFNIFLYSEALGSVGFGIFFGLLIGKPLGITLASWLAIKLHIGEMPSGATWKMLFAVACLGGIGFTMSIFVDTLSFADLTPEITEHLRSLGKISVLAGSLSAGLLGSFLISVFSRHSGK